MRCLVSHPAGRSLSRSQFHRHNPKSQIPLQQEVDQPELFDGFDGAGGMDIDDGPDLPVDAAFAAELSSASEWSGEDDEVPSSSDSSADEVILPPPPPGIPPAPVPPPVVIPPVVRPVGRPLMQNTLKDPLFDVDGACTQGEFLNELFQLNTRFNTAERFRKDLHKLIQELVCKSFPSYKRSVNLMRTKVKAADKYLACPDDHSVHPEPIASIATRCKTKKEFKETMTAIECVKCEQTLTDDNAAPKKVRKDCETILLV